MFSRCSEVLQIITDSVACPLVIIDDTGSVVLWNAAAERTLGNKQGRGPGSGPPPIDNAKRCRPPFPRGLQKVSQTGTERLLNYPVEMSVKRKEGADMVVELHITPFTLNGKWHAPGVILDFSQGEGDGREGDNKEA